MGKKEGERERVREEENIEELTQSFDKQHGEGAAFPPTANELVYIRSPPPPSPALPTCPCSHHCPGCPCACSCWHPRLHLCGPVFYPSVNCYFGCATNRAYALCALRVSFDSCQLVSAAHCCSVQPLNLLPTVPATAPPLPSIHAAVRCQNAKILCHSRIIKFKCFRFEAWQRQRQLNDAKSQRLMCKREWRREGGGEWVRQVGTGRGNGGL